MALRIAQQMSRDDLSLYNEKKPKSQLSEADDAINVPTGVHGRDRLAAANPQRAYGEIAHHRSECLESNDQQAKNHACHDQCLLGWKPQDIVEFCPGDQLVGDDHGEEPAQQARQQIKPTHEIRHPDVAWITTAGLQCAPDSDSLESRDYEPDGKEAARRCRRSAEES